MTKLSTKLKIAASASAFLIGTGIVFNGALRTYSSSENLEEDCIEEKYDFFERNKNPDCRDYDAEYVLGGLLIGISSYPLVLSWSRYNQEKFKENKK